MSDDLIWKWYIHTRSALKYSLWVRSRTCSRTFPAAKANKRRNQGRCGWSWRDWSWATGERIFRITSNNSACIYLDAIQVLLIHEFIQFPHSIASKLNLVDIMYWLWFQKISPRKNSNRAAQSVRRVACRRKNPTCPSSSCLNFNQAQAPCFPTNQAL